MKETINILCATDAKYIPYCGVMLTSLFENNKDEDIVVYVLTQDASSPSFGDYQKLAKRYNQEIKIIDVPIDLLKQNHAETEGHISIATYFRLLAPELLPKDVDKVLYMDGDVIVNGSIRDLYFRDISEYAIAGAIDCLYFDDDIYERLNYSKEQSYFNAGVALINLHWWRQQNIAKSMLAFLSKNYNKLKYYDQDVLNKVLLCHVAYFPITYNFQYFYVVENHWRNFSNELQSEIKQVANDPIVIHYCGPLKPWHYRYKGRMFNKLWWQYQRKSLWKITPIYEPYSKSVKWFLKSLLYKCYIVPKTKIMGCNEYFVNL